jgi:hypothetical protein
MFLIVVGHVFAQGPTGTPPPVVVSQVTVSNDTKRLVFPTPSEFAQSNDLLMTNGSAFNLTNFPSYLLTNTLINGRLGNVSNRIAVTTLSLQDITSADGTNVINGALAVYGDIYGSASGLTNFPANVWQNPADSTNWTWTKTATEVTLTSYTGPVDVVIPDMLDNLPVTGFGLTFKDNNAIKTVTGGNNVRSIDVMAFRNCLALTSVSFPSVITVGDDGFVNCNNLTNISLLSVSTLGDSVFGGCDYLNRIYFGQNAPSGPSQLLNSSTLTNYVMSPTATGWGATWNGRPVVRLPVSADTFYGSASGLTNFPIVATASNALLLNGLTSEEIMQVGATYYFTTNVISYGAVTGRQASLTVPTVTQSSIYTGPVTAGQYFASYLIPSNQMPTVLEIGTYIFQFYGGHITQAAKNPTIMGDLYVKDAVTATTIQEFESLPVVIPYGTNEPFKIQITTTNAYPKDGYAFLLRTKLVDTDGYTGDYQSQFGPRGYAGFTISRVVGVYVTHAEWDAVTPYRINWNTNNTYSAGTTQDFRNAVLLGGTVTISNLTVTGGNVVQTNQTQYTTTVAKASTAWQNPASATNWTSWTSDGTNITLTGYNFANLDVVIPDMLDGKPVTGFGTIFYGTAITSIRGGAKVTSIGNDAFADCTTLTSVTLPAATSIGSRAFSFCPALTSVTLPVATSIGSEAFADCSALTSVTLPAATSIGGNAFDDCTALTSVTLPAATSIGDNAFIICPSLTSVYVGQNAPAEASGVYNNAPNVTNYVTNPTATGWTNTWNGRPVVRLPVYAGNFTAAGVGAVSTNDARYLASVTNGQTNVVFNTRATVNGRVQSTISGTELGFFEGRTIGVYNIGIGDFLIRGVDDTSGFPLLSANKTYVRLYSSSNETMRVTGGKVGIGTNIPNATLHVNGSVRIEGATTNVGPLVALGGGNVLTNETDTLQTVVNRGSGPVTNAPYLVQTNATDVSFAGWRFYKELLTPPFYSYLRPAPGQAAYFMDYNGNNHILIAPFGIYFYSTNLNTAADITDVLRAYDADGANGVAVQESITNLNAQMTTKLSTTGGTLTGPLLTTLDHITTPPGDYELPSARWVRGLAMAGSECYFTPTITNGYGNKTTNFVLLSETLPASLFTNSIASPVASDSYIAGGICTNLLTAIRSTITIDAWLARVGGSSASTIPIFGEIYYIYAGTTNHLGDWTVGPLYLTDTIPQPMRWVVSFNEPTVTGAVQIIGYLKTGTVSGPAAGVNIYGGGQYSSHLDIQSSASEYTLTAAGIAAAGGATTQDTSYAAAPFCYQITLTNTSPLTFTNNWSPTQSISRITAIGTGTVTLAMNWPQNQMAYWGFCYDATGMPSTVFPAGAIYYTSGVFTNTVPTLGKSNYVSVMHSCASYQIMAFTNTLSTWGTP